MDDWEQDAEGNLVIHAIHGYQTATSPDRVLTRMTYFTPDSTLPPNTPEALQLHMTPALARKLGEDLIANADRIENNPGA
ncbi:hypothetical protein [Parasphingopyxis marina]|uniref:Uncharacterized protein n=1 Tax=Parasphingopyxis marina TaxID=2761622 RepID=A0A842HXL4_9SPHN|nr:hypothetical protein [Parasphingopyxis marina]MBC2777836.1 hypothetical protein [Parasphingopyxis marina]